MHLGVYDALGSEVASFMHGWVQAGSHEVVWQSKPLASGVGRCRLEALDALRKQSLVPLK